MSATKELYEGTIKAQLKDVLGCSNILGVPKIEKVVINMTSGELAHDSKKLQSVVEDLTAISGQKPVVTKAKKSIAGFKLREGMNVGAKVTLRKNRMYEFLDRFLNIALPRVRDFRGLSKRGFDGSGNYSLGLKEQIIFPEVNYDKVDKIRGMDITVCTTAKNDDDALKLLQAIGFPIK